MEVVAALIWDGGRFLICQRPSDKARGLLWEFAGGKVEKGETNEAALVRECREELAIEVEPFEFFTEVKYRYPDTTVHLTVYECIILKGEPKLLEHCDLKWITPEEAKDYAFCPADEEILEKIAERAREKKCMRLADKPYGKIKFRQKTVEVRLYDGKRRKIRTGDVIYFSRADGSGGKLKVKVTALHRFDSFSELFSRFAQETGGGNAEDMYAYYTPDDEKKYGVLGIEFEKLPTLKIEHYSWSADSLYRFVDKTEVDVNQIVKREREANDPGISRVIRTVLKKVHLDGADMPESPSWDYWEFQEAAVDALIALVKKPSDRRCDILKRARAKLKRAKGRDMELYARIVYELECANLKEIEGLINEVFKKP